MKQDIQKLLERPLWQMVGREFVALLEQCSGNKEAFPEKKVVSVTGVHELAGYLQCSDSMVYRLRREGVLNDAIISRIGKSIVFDAEKARCLANEYLNEKRDGQDIILTR